MFPFFENLPYDIQGRNQSSKSLVKTLVQLHENFAKGQPRCEEPLLGLNQSNDGIDRGSVPLKDEDHSGNDPHLIPGLLRLRSGTFPERFRSVSVPVGSRQNRLV